MGAGAVPEWFQTPSHPGSLLPGASQMLASVETEPSETRSKGNQGSLCRLFMPPARLGGALRGGNGRKEP